LLGRFRVREPAFLEDKIRSWITFGISMLLRRF
jgi:hypothetical protein